MAEVWPRGKALQHAHDAMVIARLIRRGAEALNDQIGDDPVLHQRRNGLRETGKRAEAFGRYGYYAARYAAMVAGYRPGTAPPDMVRAAERNADNFTKQFPSNDARYPSGTVERIAENIAGLGVELPGPDRQLLAMEREARIPENGGRDRRSVNDELRRSADMLEPTVYEELLAELQARDPSLGGRPPGIAVLESVTQGLPLGRDLGAVTTAHVVGQGVFPPSRTAGSPSRTSRGTRRTPGAGPGRESGPRRQGRPGPRPQQEP